MNGKIIQSPKGYSYIEYDDQTTNIDGFKIKVDDHLKEKIKNTGGLMHDMFAPIINDDIDHLHILHVSTPLRGEVVAIHFNSPNEYNNNVTQSGGFMKYLRDTFKEENIEVEIINSLDVAKQRPEFNVDYLLDNYSNPTSVNGIGIFIEDREIMHEDQLVSINEEHANKALQAMRSLNDSFDEYVNRTYSKIKITINKPHPFGWDVELNLYDHNNQPITYGHTYCAEELGHFPDDNEYAQYREKTTYDIIHKYANRLNDKLIELDRKDRLTDSQKEYQYDYVNRQIDYEIDEELNGVLGLPTNYYFIKSLFDKEINFTFSK